MLSLIQRIASRLFPHISLDDRSDRPLHGPLVSMLEGDIAYFAPVTWTLAEPRR